MEEQTPFATAPAANEAAVTSPWRIATALSVSVAVVWAVASFLRVDFLWGVNLGDSVPY
jgi:hypothetical protein